MKHLLTFETFVPKKIDNRADALVKINNQKYDVFYAFVAEFKKHLTAIQGLTSADPQEQLFIDLMQGSTVNTYQDVPYNMFLNNANNEYMFSYDWLHEEFTSYVPLTMALFIAKFNMKYSDWQKFIIKQMQKHFNCQSDKVWLERHYSEY